MDKNTIRTDSWTAVYNLLQTGTYAITTNNIYSAFNSALITSVGYPLVIIYMPECDIKKLSINGNIRNIKVSMLFEIYHTNAKDCKSVADEVTKQLMAAYQVLAGTNRLMNMEIMSSGSDAWQDGNRTIHRIAFTANWRYVEEGLT